MLRNPAVPKPHPLSLFPPMMSTSDALKVREFVRGMQELGAPSLTGAEIAAFAAAHNFRVVWVARGVALRPRNAAPPPRPKWMEDPSPLIAD